MMHNVLRVYGAYKYENNNIVICDNICIDNVGRKHLGKHKTPFLFIINMVLEFSSESGPPLPAFSNCICLAQKPSSFLCYVCCSRICYSICMLLSMMVGLYTALSELSESTDWQGGPGSSGGLGRYMGREGCGGSRYLTTHLIH